MKTFLFPVLLILSGCATSSGVMPSGKDTYMLLKRDAGIAGSLGALKVDAYREATQFCESKGKAFQVISSNGTPRAVGNIPEIEIQFACIDSATSVPVQQSK